jgi:hypothetical protein
MEHAGAPHPPWAHSGDEPAVRISAMFEVIVTYRPDFTEQVVDRYPTREQAEAAAQRLAAEHDRIIRAYVRPVQKAQTRS